MQPDEVALRTGSIPNELPPRPMASEVEKRRAENAIAMKAEIPFKQWKAEEAQRRGVTFHAFEMMLTRGQVARPPMRVVNQRVKFVIQRKP